jgi:hypothetical protein
MPGSSTPFCLAPENEQLPPALLPYDHPSLPSSSGDEDDDDENEEETMKEEAIKEQLATISQKSSIVGLFFHYSRSLLGIRGATISQNCSTYLDSRSFLPV